MARPRFGAWNSQSFVFKMSSFLCVRPGTVHHTCAFASGPRPRLLLLERIGCMQEVHHGPTVEVRRDSANPRPSPLISTPSILHKPHTLDPKPEAPNPTLWHRPLRSRSAAWQHVGVGILGFLRQLASTSSCQQAHACIVPLGHGVETQRGRLGPYGKK